MLVNILGGGWWMESTEWINGFIWGISGGIFVAALLFIHSITGNSK